VTNRERKLSRNVTSSVTTILPTSVGRLGGEIVRVLVCVENAPQVLGQIVIEFSSTDGKANTLMPQLAKSIGNSGPGWLGRLCSSTPRPVFSFISILGFVYKVSKEVYGSHERYCYHAYPAIRKKNPKRKTSRLYT
jgi:hypothetical protein